MDTGAVTPDHHTSKARTDRGMERRRYDQGREVATYGTFYRAEDGRLWEAQSSIRFASMDAIAAGLSEAGLTVRQWLGNWQGEAFEPGCPGDDRGREARLDRVAGEVNSNALILYSHNIYYGILLDRSN